MWKKNFIDICFRLKSIYQPSSPGLLEPIPCWNEVKVPGQVTSGLTNTYILRIMLLFYGF